MALNESGSGFSGTLAALKSRGYFLSVGVATAGASTGSQALCTNNGGTYSTKAGGSTTSQALVAACLSNDGGKGITTQDGPPGDATCWVNPFTTQGQGVCESNGCTYSTDPKTSLFGPTKARR